MKRAIGAILILLLLVVAAPAAEAMCPMCKINVEASMESGVGKGHGLNQGITYLLFVPYLLVSILIGYLVYLGKRKRRMQPMSLNASFGAHYRG